MKDKSFYLKIIYDFVLLLFIFVSSTILQTYIKYKNRDIEKLKVDLVYKYIDLRDPSLKREGINQIDKDYDNEELRYSIRSVIYNIPWINKIYIIMPNDKVRFLKDTRERKKKIIYIKDKDILGFDSSSSITFEHAALKNLGKYGVSDTFIYMNDDYFIAKPLKKKDYFYYSEKEKRFVPYVMKHFDSICTDCYDYYVEYYNNYSYLLNTECNHSTVEYRFQNCLSYLFLYKYFNRTNIKVLSPEHGSWHSSLPLSIKDLEELYEVVKNNYEYSDILFNSKERNNKQMTFEKAYSFYFLNKYDRLYGHIKRRYYQISQANRVRRKNSDVFVMNKSNKNESIIDNVSSKFRMNFMFKKRYKEEVPEIEDGKYYIHSCINDSYVFDVKNKMFYKKYIILQPFEKKESQQFYIKYEKRGYYHIYSNYYKKFIMYVFSKIYLRHTVALNNNNEGKERRWLLIPYEDNKFYFVSMKNYKFLQLSKIKNNNNNIFKFKNLIIDDSLLFRLEKF